MYYKKRKAKKKWEIYQKESLYTRCFLQRARAPSRSGGRRERLQGEGVCESVKKRDSFKETPSRLSVWKHTQPWGRTVSFTLPSGNLRTLNSHTEDFFWYPKTKGGFLIDKIETNKEWLEGENPVVSKEFHQFWLIMNCVSSLIDNFISFLNYSHVQLPVWRHFNVRPRRLKRKKSWALKESYHTHVIKW